MRREISAQYEVPGGRFFFGTLLLETLLWLYVYPPTIEAHSSGETDVVSPFSLRIQILRMPGRCLSSVPAGRVGALFDGVAGPVAVVAPTDGIRPLPGHVANLRKGYDHADVGQNYLPWVARVVEERRRGATSCLFVSKKLFEFEECDARTIGPHSSEIHDTQDRASLMGIRSSGDGRIDFSSDRGVVWNR